MKAWERIRPGDRAAVLSAAVRFSRWFGQDCQARNRNVEAGLPYVPHLAKWLDGGQADPSLAVIDAGSEDFRALVRHRGRAPFVGQSGRITVPVAELAEAREAADRSRQAGGGGG